MDRRNEVFVALEALRNGILEDAVELARRRHQLAQITATITSIDADISDVSAALSTVWIERPA